MRLYVLGLLLAVSCTKPNPNSGCEEGTCRDPAFPYCDVEGVIAGEPGLCLSVSCTPGAIETCIGDMALTCNGEGNGYDRVPCELGCESSPTPHCAYIEPRYVPDVCDSFAPEATLEITSSGTFDPNLDSNCNGGVLPQPGAPSICVVRYRRISILADQTLKVTGTHENATGRPVAFVADEDLSVAGILDVSADGPVNGPGGGVTASGGGTMVTSSTTHTAAGGAGGKTAGGAGGSSAADGGATNGGLAMADPALLAALIGGASAWPHPSRSSFAGGGGGGAITLVACRGVVSVTGTIDAGGGGGKGGTFEAVFTQLGTPGLAGGAGGYVVLQGQRVSVTGQLFTNGGGGGAGMQSNQQEGERGRDGSLSTSANISGGLGLNSSGRGGNGGFGTTAPSVGGRPTMTPATAGGGGGSVGFLQVYTPEGITPNLESAQTSPAFQPNATIRTR